MENKTGFSSLREHLPHLPGSLCVIEGPCFANGEKGQPKEWGKIRSPWLVFVKEEMLFTLPLPELFTSL